MPSFSKSSLFALAVLVLLSVSTQAEDWPRFRGVSGSGVSTSQDLPAEIGPDQKVLWKQETASGSSSPIIVAGKIYLASYQDDERIVECFDAATGGRHWRQAVRRAREENSNRLNGPATCTPMCDGENVVVFFPDTALLCYSTTGSLRWRADVGPFYSMHGIANSPVIADGKVILMIDQLQDSYLAAYDLKSGKELWKQQRANGVTGGYSTPTIMRPENRKPIIVTSGPGGLYAYDLPTGEPLLTVPGVANAPVTIPILFGSRAILTEPVGEAMPMAQMLPNFDKNNDGKISFDEARIHVGMLRLMERIERGWGNGDEMVDSAEWNRAFGTMIDKGGLVAIDIADQDGALAGKIAWNHRKSVPYVSTPVIYENLLYMVKDGGVFTVIDPKDGEVVLEKRLRKGGKPVYASPVAADGKIYVIDTSGQLTVIQAGRDGQELHTVSMGEPCMATPAICDGRIYLRTPTKLYCFGKS